MKRLCLAWVGFIGAASVRMNLKLSLLEWGGLRTPEDRVTSLAYSDSSWCEETVSRILSKKGSCGSHFPDDGAVYLHSIFYGSFLLL